MTFLLRLLRLPLLRFFLLGGCFAYGLGWPTKQTQNHNKPTTNIGAALACAAGVFLAIDTQVETRMGFKLLLPMFAAAIVGGVGRPYGAVAGGLIIGLAEELSSYPWVGTTPLLNPGYKAGVAFAIMVGMLLWRPSGLFKGRVF